MSIGRKGPASGWWDGRRAERPTLPRKDVTFNGAPRPADVIESLRELGDAMTLEAIEFASVRAEERACAFLRANPSVDAVRGSACVAARFQGEGTFASFLRIDAILNTARSDLWLIRRRWASAGGDARLDEAMCVIVAAHLNRAFGKHIEAFVVVRIA